MTYRKFQAAQLFTGYEMLNDEQVLITDENGMVLNISSVEEAGDDIQQLNGIISPGFINCHCHLELSHMKDRIPERTGLVDFVYKVVTERHYSPEEIHSAIESAETHMMEKGIVAVGDICNNALTIPQKNKGRLYYYNFIEASGWLPEISKQRFDRALQLFYEFEKSGKPASATSIVPHAPYSVSEKLWELIKPYFQNKTVTIHNQETAFEDEFFLHGSGDLTRMYQMMKIDSSHHKPSKRSSLQSYFHQLQSASSSILVHNTFTKQADLEFIRSESTLNIGQTFFCICINANLYIENSIPPVELLRANDCRIVLGTDSLASNRELDILSEIKKINEHFPAIPLVEILQWATINGAQALGVHERYGSFEKGKSPGVVLIGPGRNECTRIL
jgi:aminodeoxyfutalosine deaminase